MKIQFGRIGGSPRNPRGVRRARPDRPRVYRRWSSRDGGSSSSSATAGFAVARTNAKMSGARNSHFSARVFMLFSSLLTLFGSAYYVVPGMGREELPHSEGISWGGLSIFLSNGSWNMVFLRHYI